AWSKRTIVSHHLLRVSSERGIVWCFNSADIADDDRRAVLSALFVGQSRSHGETFVRGVRHPTRVVDDRRRILQSGAFAVTDENRLSDNRDSRRILTRGNEPTHFAASVLLV